MCVILPCVETSGGQDIPIFRLKKLPITILLVAFAAALIHMAPYWRAASEASKHPGWSFTGNITVSPDQMQYRAWPRLSQETGLLVPNTFTPEDNKPHIPVLFYYVLGSLAQIAAITPELAYAYAGAIFAFALTVLVFLTVRVFLQDARRTWWVFGVLMVGGGLGAHLILLTKLEFARSLPLFQRLVGYPVESVPFFDGFRDHYIFITLFDSHFLLVWLVATAAVVSLYFTFKAFSVPRLLLTAGLYLLITILHVYEGPTLAVITISTAVLCFRYVESRVIVITSVICVASIAAGLSAIALVWTSSGLPLPTWRGENVLTSTLFIAYPLAWIAIAWGGIQYWNTAGFNERFLVGWVVGCTLLTLSGPFYPYPARGAMTLQIPLYIIAGSIFFANWSRVTPKVALLFAFVLLATPAWHLGLRWQATSFSPDHPQKFISQDHAEIIAALRDRAGPDDILLVNKKGPDWKADDVWLAPEYPGRHYAGHSFLTVNYNRKRSRAARFFTSRPDEQAKFLSENKIRFVFVNAPDKPDRFLAVKNLNLLRRNSVGALFEVAFAAADPSTGQSEH